MKAAIWQDSYGKSRVRLTKVRREGDRHPRRVRRRAGRSGGCVAIAARQEPRPPGSLLAKFQSCFDSRSRRRCDSRTRSRLLGQLLLRGAETLHQLPFQQVAPMSPGLGVDL